MTERYIPKRLVLLDIDALRNDVFRRALAEGAAPNLSRLVGGARAEKGLHFEAISCAPSITYCCQASSITGAHPRDHWIPGNMFFDRFGRLNNGLARKYEFDFLDAPQVFSKGLAGNTINPAVDTLYETAAQHGRTSTVVYNMYAHGAQHWLKPGLEDWRLFASISKPNFGELYDDHMLSEALDHLRQGHRPDVLMLYFFGLDHDSHMLGPKIQFDYLTQVIDRQIGDFLREYEALGLLPDTLFCIFSDHGQLPVQNDDQHTLRVGFLFDRELGYVFESLNLDVNDHLLEGADCDALLTPNGGMAHVYLRHRSKHWPQPPAFNDVLALAKAFWDSTLSGVPCADLKGALEAVLVRDCEHEGWYADYQIYTPGGLLPVSELQVRFPDREFIDPANRLHNLTSPYSGDILLFADSGGGYSFSLLPYLGMHGSLHPDDSKAVLAYGLPAGSPEQVESMQYVISKAIFERCLDENQRRVSNVDVAYGLRAMMDWL